MAWVLQWKSGKRAKMTIQMKQEYDKAKLMELVMYIAAQSAADPRFGKTKLQKALFFSDFLAYQYTKQAITGATYEKLPYGPCAKELSQVLDELEAQGAIQVVLQSAGRYRQERVEAQRAADTSVFTPAELQMVDKVLSALRNKNAQQVSGLSHKFAGYRIAHDRQPIPYASVFLNPARKPQRRDVVWAQAIAAANGELSAV